MELKTQRIIETEDVLSRLGWRWAVLCHTIGQINKKREKIPSDILHQIRNSRTKLESGCYSVCDLETELRGIESVLMTKLQKFGPIETDNFLELIYRAMSGSLSVKDLNLSGIHPTLSDCLDLPCVCKL
jgi:hypothetical protein